MTLARRSFLRVAAGGLAAAWSRPALALGTRVPRFAAIAFDAFPILDPRPIGALAEQLFPGRGAELMNAWRTRQFEYQWLRALGGRHADFLRTTEDGLVFAARQLGVELGGERRDRLMQAWLELPPWPDAPGALRALRAAGVRLAFVSNMTSQLLEAGIRNARLEGIFEHVISTDRARTFKPAPRAYQLGVDALGLRREEILFAAFAGWDATGAKWFGHPTFWVNRARAPAEELGATPDATGRDLNDLVRWQQESG